MHLSDSHVHLIVYLRTKSIQLKVLFFIDRRQNKQKKSMELYNGGKKQ